MKFRALFTRERLEQATLLLLPPLTSFYLMQFILGVLPWELAPGVVLANSLCIGAVYFLLWAATGYPAVCCLLLHILCGVWGAANYFVALYRGTPVLPWDLTALETAAAVSGSYSFSPTGPMLAGIALVALLAWLLRHKFREGRFLIDRHTAPLRCLSLVLGVFCLSQAVHTESLGRFGVETDVWDQLGAYQKSGAVAAFLRNTEFMEVEEPEDLSSQRLSWIMDQVELPEETAVSADHPNIIAIMNESWADFEEFGTLSLSESVTDYIRSLDNAIWGHAYTSVFGAGTSASEFEFLTGNSMAFLPSGSIPYQQYILDDSPSLASLLREEGYRTLAFHPGERTSWQRDRAYPRLGFDAYKCGDDMDVPQTFEHGYVSDESDFRQLIWELEHKEAGQPIFLFNVTIQNHGGYTAADYPAQVTLTDAPGEYPMAEQYLTLANKTDQAFRTLVEYLEDFDEPTIVVMFGDHQPSVEQGFLDRAYGVTQDQMTMEQYMGRFYVPFVIWANYPLPESGPEVTSLNFLGQYLLRYAGIGGTAYDNYLWQLQTRLPAVTFVGYVDANGRAYSHLETNGFTPEIEDYQRVQYNNIFGGKERLTALFDP